MVFDLFSSKKNIQNIRDTISETIEHEFHFKIGLRYDPLIESKVKEVMSKVSDQVPEGKSVKDYILMMNKKVISLVLPTIRANALKEKSRSHLPERRVDETRRERIMDDPQDLLKRGNTRLVPEPVDAQFSSIPLEDMRERTLPDYPRPMPKMESSKENTNTNTLDMFNQLRSVYQAEQKASGIHDHVHGSFSEGKEETFVEAHNHNPNRKIVLRKQKMETPIEPLPQPEKVMEMITPLHSLLLPSQYSEKERVDDLRCNSVDPKDPNRVDDSLLMSSAKRVVVKRIHYSSNYRSFMFHHSPSMFRIYLTPYFDNLYDPFVYFQLPEYTTASGAMLHSSFQLQYDMKHHPHIPNIKNVKNIYIDHVKLYDGYRRGESIYAELIPSLHDEPNIYHNHAHLGHDILLYNPQSGAFCAEHANRNIKEESLKTIQKNGYIQVNLYDMYHDYIHYDQDVAFIEKIEQKDGKTLLFLRGSMVDDLRSNSVDPNDSLLMSQQISVPLSHSERMRGTKKVEPGEKIYIYSLCHDHHRYVEFGERVFANKMELVDAEKGSFSFSAMYMDEKEGKEEMVSFEEVFEKHREHLEDLSHKSISDLFYFVIQQVDAEKRIYYDCQIVEFNREDGSVILYHKEFDRILANFENTEQFGFILKNLNGLQSDDRSDLHRKHGFVVEKVIEPNTLVLDYQGAIDANFSEGFIRHHRFQIDIQCVLEF